MSLSMSVLRDGRSRSVSPENPAGEREQLRTAAIEAAGFIVLRFWNNDVLENIDGVLQEIVRAIEHR